MLHLFCLNIYKLINLGWHIEKSVILIIINTCNSMEHIRGGERINDDTNCH